MDVGITVPQLCCDVSDKARSGAADCGGKMSRISLKDLNLQVERFLGSLMPRNGIKVQIRCRCTCL